MQGAGSRLFVEKTIKAIDLGSAMMILQQGASRRNRKRDGEHTMVKPVKITEL